MSDECGGPGREASGSPQDCDSVDQGNVYSLPELLEKRGDDDRAHAWARQAAMSERADLRATAEAGDSGAMFEYARVLVSWNMLEEAQPWYRRAAEAGHSEAMYEFGQLLYGRGSDEARTWFRRAAGTGSVHAMLRIGSECERHGDFTEAAIWYRCAVEAGETYAEPCLARVQEVQRSEGGDVPEYGPKSVGERDGERP
ncbi:hypothetical protein ABZ413_24945 [Nocardia rhamnosiphila]|uniref:tetratricopeptide repeat protein n=1 Tax=Nocardia rhamnosiphila TaxID=426716 RepID=UPI00340AA4CA